MDFKDYLIYSLTLENHPMSKAKEKVQAKYYHTLTFFLEQLNIQDTEKALIEQKQKEYKFLLENFNQSQPYIPKHYTLNLWKRDYIFCLFCDLLLMTQGIIDANQIVSVMDDYLNFINKLRIKKLIQMLTTYKYINLEQPQIVENYFKYKREFKFTRNLIEQNWHNLNFSDQSEKRIIITANMSAGKSTLINALIGKNIARTSQECCTGNLCYIYNKPFEDNRIHLKTDELNLDVDYDTLRNYKWDKPIYMATYFNQPTKQRICLIDTPGVNSSINREHGQITKEALKNEQYDILLYILNANKLGTEEEISYLTWIYKNVPEDKILFVLNKLDEFQVNEDDIQKSIEGVQDDLKQIGYIDPIVCPLSAYFAYLLKKKYYSKILTKYEEIELKMYTQIFSIEEYNLSKYYIDKEENPRENEFINFNQKCGMYYLEKVLGIIPEQSTNTIAI